MIDHVLGLRSQTLFMSKFPTYIWMTIDAQRLYCILFCNVRSTTKTWKVKPLSCIPLFRARVQLNSFMSTWWINAANKNPLISYGITKDFWGFIILVFTFTVQKKWSKFFSSLGTCQPNTYIKNFKLFTWIETIYSNT